jgi:hypothetical protein
MSNTLRPELVLDALAMALTRRIEGFYNPRRRQSAMNNNDRTAIAV